MNKLSGRYWYSFLSGLLNIFLNSSLASFSKSLSKFKGLIDRYRTVFPEDSELFKLKGFRVWVNVVSGDAGGGLFLGVVLWYSRWRNSFAISLGVNRGVRVILLAKNLYLGWGETGVDKLWLFWRNCCALW